MPIRCPGSWWNVERCPGLEPLPDVTDDPSPTIVEERCGWPLWRPPAPPHPGSEPYQRCATLQWKSASRGGATQRSAPSPSIGLLQRARLSCRRSGPAPPTGCPRRIHPEAQHLLSPLSPRSEVYDIDRLVECSPPRRSWEMPGTRAHRPSSPHSPTVPRLFAWRYAPDFVDRQRGQPAAHVHAPVTPAQLHVPDMAADRASRGTSPTPPCSEIRPARFAVMANVTS